MLSGELCLRVLYEYVTIVLLCCWNCSCVESREEKVSSDGAMVTTQPHVSEHNDGLQLWIIVLIIVTIGFLVVTCTLCLCKLHRWKRDRGTYSIWNDQGPSLEAMCTRESGVLFERLDVEPSLSEAQCYEIPVDSLEAPQRVCIEGFNAISVAETSRKNDRGRCFSDGDTAVNVIDGTEYCVVPHRTSCPARTVDVQQRESLPSSVGPQSSAHSSVSFSTSSVSERTLTPGVETLGKEIYPKPLPVIPGESEPVVLCETYQLDEKPVDDRVTALVNRPLPQTPHLAPPLLYYSAASLDRTLLKQQKEARLDKPALTSRTLPRPRRIRQLPIPKPLINVISRSVSSNDVSKEAERLSDHVASDPKKCTLTKIQKRKSQSLDTLIASQRTSHFYENPYIVEGTAVGSDGYQQGQGRSSEGEVDTSNELLPKDKEHLYTRISQCMDVSDSKLNRHSYASIHYSSFRSRPKSKHVYIDIIIGSADTVFIPSIENSHADHETSVRSTLAAAKTRTQSCPDFMIEHLESDVKNQLTPRPWSYYVPPNSPYTTNDAKAELPHYHDYQNTRNQIPKQKAITSHEPIHDPSSEGIYKTPRSLNVRPYYENITSDNEHRRAEMLRSYGPHVDTSHYGVPKTPAIPLERFSEILRTKPDWLPESTARNDGKIKICERKGSSVKTENECDKVARRKEETLSEYLEGRFDVKEFDESQVSAANVKAGNEPIYQNFLSGNRERLVSEESTSSQEKLSLGSCLSIEDKDVSEKHPLISRASQEDVNDVNGNSVYDGFLEKVEVRRNSLVGRNLLSESVA